MGHPGQRIAPTCYGLPDTMRLFLVPVLVPMAWAISAVAAVAWSRKRKSKLFPIFMETAGPMTLVSFIPLISSGFQAFDCYAHPSREAGRSLRMDPSISCESDRYRTEIQPPGIAVLLLALLIATLLAFYIWKVPALPFSAPRCFFMTRKFEPNAYYWSTCQLSRNVLVSMCPVLVPDNAFVTANLVAAVSLFYGLAVCLKSPWAIWQENFADGVSSVCIALTAGASVHFAAILHYRDDEGVVSQDDSWTILKAIAQGPLFLSLVTFALLGAYAFKEQLREKVQVKAARIIGNTVPGLQGTPEPLQGALKNFSTKELQNVVMAQNLVWGLAGGVSEALKELPSRHFLFEPTATRPVVKSAYEAMLNEQSNAESRVQKPQQDYIDIPSPEASAEFEDKDITV